MINALRYKPRSQRQRFEPREQQNGERQEQGRHIHLYLHLNLTLRTSQGRSTQSHTTRIMSIFVALVYATAIPLWLFAGWLLDHTSSTLSVLAGMFLVGLALAWGGGCVPLLVSARRAIPRDRFVLLVRLLVLFSLLPLWVMPILGISVLTFFHLFWLLFAVQPLISAILFAWVSHEVRALRQVAPASPKHRLVIVSGMALMLLAGLLLNLSVLLSGSTLVSPLLFLLVICAAVIVAICTLFTSHKKAQPRPKNASLSDVTSTRSRGYSPVDGNREEKPQGEPE